MSGYSNKKVYANNNGVEILEYSGVTLELSQNGNVLKLDGNWFVIDYTDPAYYHFLVENVGQFYAMKKIVPDLKLAIRTDKKYDGISYIAWCVEKLIEENNPILFDSGIVYIENLYAASTRLVQIFSMIDSVFDLVVKDEYQDMVIPALRDFFLRNLPKLDKSEKIYAIRRDKSEELSARLEYLDYLKSNGVTWDNGDIQDPKRTLENIPSKFKQGWVARILNNKLTSVEMDTMTRYISDEEETMLEQFLLNNGYKFFSHLSMSYEDQMSMIASCKSYVCITGASALNAIVCPKDASIYIVNPDTNWPMPNHEYAASLVSDNAHTVFKIRDYPNQKFTMQQVINRLKELM